MEKTILSDGVMEARVVHSGWVFIRWVGEQSSRFKMRLYKDLKQVEDHIRQHRLLGWLVCSEPEHKTMHGIFNRLGAQQYGRDDEHLFFKKEFSHV